MEATLTSFFFNKFLNREDFLFCYKSKEQQENNY